MELMETLEEFSLSKREAEIHLTLLREMKFAAAELSKITAITITKIYENLRNLVHKGLCNENINEWKKILSAVESRMI